MNSLHSLRKTSTGLHLAYKYGGGTDKLRGSHITLEADGSVMTLGIDLSSNFRKRDKNAGSYLEAVALAREHHKLKLLQCHDNLVRARLVRAWESVPSPQLRLALSMGSRGICMYSVAPRSLFMGGVQLDVLAVLGMEHDDPFQRPGHWHVPAAQAPGFQHSHLH